MEKFCIRISISKPKGFSPLFPVRLFLNKNYNKSLSLGFKPSCHVRVFTTSIFLYRFLAIISFLTVIPMYTYTPQIKLVATALHLTNNIFLGRLISARLNHLFHPKLFQPTIFESKLLLYLKFGRTLRHKRSGE